MMFLNIMVWAVLPTIVWAVWLPYLTGLIVLVVGLSVILRKEISQSRGLDKVVCLGPIFFAVPIGIFGAEHFAFTESIMQFMPAWIPGHRFWVLLVGACLISAALSIVIQKLEGLSATLLAVMFFMFELLLHIPGIVGDPTNRFLWAVALRDLTFCGGALSLAATQSEAWPAHVRHKIVVVARFFIGSPILFFGVEHLLHPNFRPGVPLAGITPSWIPARLFWGYLTGAVFVAAGLCLIANKQVRAAATWLGLMIFLLVLVVYAPMVIAKPSDIGDGFNYLFDTLMLSGSVFLFAATQRQRRRAEEVSVGAGSVRSRVPA